MLIHKTSKSRYNMKYCQSSVGFILQNYNNFDYCECSKVIISNNFNEVELKYRILSVEYSYNICYLIGLDHGCALGSLFGLATLALFPFHSIFLLFSFVFRSKEGFLSFVFKYELSIPFHYFILLGLYL